MKLFDQLLFAVEYFPDLIVQNVLNTYFKGFGVKKSTQKTKELLKNKEISTIFYNIVKNKREHIFSAIIY